MKDHSPSIICIMHPLELPALMPLRNLRACLPACLACSSAALLLFPASRGAIVTVFVISYALTSIVGGYVSGGYYARNSGEHYARDDEVCAYTVTARV